MTIYWLMFLLPAWLSITEPSKLKKSNTDLEFSWLLIGSLLVLLVGLRHQVGGDWLNYENNYFNLTGLPLSEMIKKGDPGYQLFSWISIQLNGGTYLVNLFSGLFFSWGLIAFCREQPQPWLALAVSIPYMVIVVAMGYSRQGIALGLAMLGMIGVAKQSNFQFLFCVAIASLFHKSAVLLVPIAILATPRSKILTGIWIGISSALLYYLLLADSVEGLVSNYIEAGYQSEGAAVRVLMNALPATIFLFFRKKFILKTNELNFWTGISLLSLACVGWLTVSSSSTAVDRIALYFIPLQLFVFSRLPNIFELGNNIRSAIIFVLVYYAAVLFVWLNFATHSYAWLPYQSWFFT